MANEVFEAAAGTRLECIKDVIQPGTIKIYKYQPVKKVQNFDSGKIAVETLHTARLAIVDPDYFKIKPESVPLSRKRNWKFNQHSI